MATCKDCLHFDVCEEWVLKVGNNPYINANDCEHFKNKADYAEVKHGEWIVSESLLAADKLGLSIPLRWYKCSLCGRTEFEREPYCNCGAKMDGRSDSDDL